MSFPIFAMSCNQNAVVYPTVYCLTSYVPCLTSLYLVSRPLSPVLYLLCSLSSVLCPLSHISVLVSRPMSPVLYLLCSLSSVLCPLSHVSVLVSHPLSLPDVSRPSSLSPVLYTLSQVICPLSPILLSPSPKPYQPPRCPISVALFHCSCPFSSVSCPLFLLSSVLCLSYL